MPKVFNLAGHIFRSNFADLPYPYRMTFILTYECHFRCQMCHIWQKKTKDELSLEEIDRFFSKSNRFSWINLSGGETFQRKDLVSIIKIIYARCPSLYLLDFPTNGYHTDRIVAQVKEVLKTCPFPKLLVTVSLDGPQGLHDKIRGIPGSWDRAVKTFEMLHLLKNKRFDVFLGMTLQPDNRDSFEATLQSVQDRIPGITAANFHVNIAHHSSHYYVNSPMFHGGEQQQLWETLRPIMQLRKTHWWDPVGYLERRYQQHAKIYLEKNVTPITCQALNVSFFMDPTGKVFPCSIWDKSIGNIRDFDYDMDKLWDSNMRRDVRGDLRAGNCPNCWTPCEAYQSILADILPKWGKT